MKVMNMTSTRTEREVPNQFLLEGVPAGTFYDGEERLPSGRAFQSYHTMIAFVDIMGMVYLDTNAWDYSATTSRYRNQFLGMTTPEVKKGIKDGTIKLIDLN